MPATGTGDALRRRWSRCRAPGWSCRPSSTRSRPRSSRTTAAGRRRCSSRLREDRRRPPGRCARSCRRRRGARRGSPPAPGAAVRQRRTSVLGPGAGRGHADEPGVHRGGGVRRRSVAELARAVGPPAPHGAGDEHRAGVIAARRHRDGCRSNPTTATGVVAPVAVPLPSCPLPFAPQHRTPPSATSAQACARPAVIALAPPSPATAATFDRGVVVPSPSWPDSFCPNSRPCRRPPARRRTRCRRRPRPSPSCR